ncbi:MAG: hypothetical protein K8I27_09325 [Planctomycetes bacterium]|nr:hypothetical protein [Planctomycetota bacterium]
MKKLLIVMLAVVLCVADAGVVAEPAAPERAEVTLRILRGDRSEILDPHATNSGADVDVVRLMYESLVTASDTAPVQWAPCLAESWQHDDSFTRWTFKLRKGVKFHDGAELNAAAVKRSFDRARNINDPGAPRMLPYAAEHFDDISTIKTPDDLTVVFELNEGDPKFITSVSLFAAAIVSPTAIKHLEDIKDASERQSWLSRHPAGTGPYRLTKVENFDARLIWLNAFTDYWGGRPSVDYLKIETETDAKTRNESLLAGKADFVPSIPPADREALSKAESVHLSVRPGENICYLAMNCSEKAARPTGDLKLRKAIALAVRRQSYVELYSGAVSPLYGLLPPTIPGHLPDYKPAGDELADDAARKQAKTLLDEVGLPKEPLKMIIPSVPRPYLSQPTETADLIKQQLAAVGIEVKIEPVAMREIVDIALTEDYDLLLLGWMGEMGDADNFYAPLLGGNEGRAMDVNFARFLDKDLVKQLDKARLERSPDKRREIFEQLEKTVFDKHRPMVPLYTTTMAEGWRAEWTGIRIDAIGGWHFEGARKS